MLKSVLKVSVFQILFLSILIIRSRCVDLDQPTISSSLLLKGTPSAIQNSTDEQKPNIPDLNKPLSDNPFSEYPTTVLDKKENRHTKRLKRYSELGILDDYREKEKTRMRKYHANLPKEVKKIRVKEDVNRRRLRMLKVRKDNR